MPQFLKKLAIYLAVYVMIFGFYLYVTPGIGDHAFGLHMRRFIPAALAVCMPYFLFKEFKLRNFKLELIVSLFWAITSPYFAYLASKISGSTPSLPYDVATGAYLFSTLVFAKILIQKYANYAAVKLLFYLVQLALFLVPLFHTIYFLIFSHPMSSNGMMVIFQTNPAEAIEYIASVSIAYKLMTAVLVAAFIFSIYKDICNTSAIASYVITRKKLIVSCVVMPIVGYYTFFSLIPRTQFIEIVRSTQGYFNAIEKYSSLHGEVLNDLQVESIRGGISSSPNTIVLVIGESATRNYMQAFMPDNDPTTPWLSSKKDDFLLFKNAYSCAWNTVPALEHALTEANYYNNKEFNRSASIIDMAKKAGYKTYWFSNQGKIGMHDTPITMVAETCDVAKWGGTSKYDEGLLNSLKTVDKNGKNFVVLHILGSHIDYNRRYPAQYQIWTDPDTTGRVADYKNSLVYTDTVLRSFYDYAHDNLNLSAFIYFADHGTDPNRSRDPDETRFIGLRIPMFIYLSDSYKQNNPEAAAALAANQDKFFSNDLVYNLVCGVLGIKSNRYDETESIASSKYKFTIENTKAGLGTKSVKDDPHLKE